jgi:hypothetical protein
MKKLAIIFASLGVVGLAACGPVQSEQCAQYITCQAAVDEEANTTTADGLADTYGDGGTCWTSNAEVADACTTACESALDANATAYEDITECDAA